jgi:transketolase
MRFKNWNGGWLMVCSNGAVESPRLPDFKALVAQIKSFPPARRRQALPQIEELCRLLRQALLISLEKAKSGHPGGSLSSIEILAALYFYKLRYDPLNPEWEARDYFLLSKGHICPALYTVMAAAGFFPAEELLTLRQLGTRLQGHPHRLKLPGLETSCGSLGQGLSIANGIALGLKLDHKPNRVYCLLGDGEMQEGQVWEAIMTAAHHHLDNLCAIVDYNKLQIDGWVEDIKGLAPLDAKLTAFNWKVLSVDGHNLEELMSALDEAAGVKDRPVGIIARTIKGKGVSFMANQADWHGKAPNREELEQALKELDDAKKFKV